MSTTDRPGTHPVSAPADAGARVAAQARFETRTLLSNGEQLLVSVILPALALFGLIHASVPDLGDGARVDLAVPGVLALAVVSTAFTGQAIATAFDRRYGLLRLLGVTPLGPRGLMLGKALAVLSVIAVQVVLLGLLGLAFGWRPHLATLPITVVLLVLGGFVFTCLGLALAGTVRPEGVLALANLIWVLLLAGGGLLFDTSLLPSPASTLVSWLPSGALGDGLRAALAHGDIDGHALLVLVIWGVVGATLVRRFFRWSD
ncbi:ABC transporter permease [Dermacoccaceae bacterium W4C1]